MKRRFCRFRFAGGAALALAALTNASAHGPADHAAWDQLLRRHVREGRVDYQGLAQERPALQAYLAALAETHVGHLPSKADQLAYWLNLYNACVVEGVLEHLPLDSVKQVPGFFTSPRCRFGEERLTIDEVGAGAHAIGGLRIHFAIVCASMGCPALRDEAYQADRLEEQLADQARRYFSDPSRGLRLEAETQTVWVSKIIHWNRADFRQPDARWFGLAGSFNLPALAEVLAPYVSGEVREQISEAKRARIIPYDWALNHL